MRAAFTLTDRNAGITWRETLLAAGEPDVCHMVCIYPLVRYQTVQSFGGAFSEATVHLAILCRLDI